MQRLYSTSAGLIHTTGQRAAMSGTGRIFFLLNVTKW